MNKITKKLFRYYLIIAVCLSATVFIGFCGVLRYYMIHHHLEEIQDQIKSVKKQLEWMLCEDSAQGRGAYLKYLEDVTLADIYVINKDGSPFTCGKNPDSEKTPPDEVQEFADTIFASEEYEQQKQENSDILYAGMPVEIQGEVTAVIVFVDTLKIDRKSFFISATILLVCLLFSLILSAILAAFLANRFMHPIQKIATSVQEMIHGNYQVKTDVYDKNEIGILAKETDILAEKLDTADKDRERMQQMQKNYITNISHELRTPVTMLRSSIEALHDGMVPEDKIGDYQEQILTETISLQRLINDMLELSRLENEDFPIEKESVDLIIILEDAIRTMRFIAGKRNIQIHYQNTEQEWPFIGDYGRLRQMFIAVLDNAVKYSDDGKNIWVEAFTKANHYYISIRDEGCGIPEDKQKLIFNKFYRSSYERTSGTGLGMAITKSIADRHHIEIRLHSIYKKETKLTFIIPISIKEIENDTKKTHSPSMMI